ncbi:retrovirus-related Pol polyprotein from transposon 297 [Trichonephila clavipes]|nr:retrovirus-related Pol polyprotein from transposon 297 [Trichonephila clavipes]
MSLAVAIIRSRSKGLAAESKRTYVHKLYSRRLAKEMSSETNVCSRWSLELELWRKVENVSDFLENIDNNLTYYKLPTQLASAYLKGHLTGRALDCFDVLGYKVVEEKATDYAHLKQSLTEQFPVVRNRLELETRFYALYPNRNQRPSEFVYELLKIHKHLKLEMVDEKLQDHIISRLEPQLLDYVEVRHPQTTFSLLQLIDKYGENWRDTRVNNRYYETSRQQRESNRFGGQDVDHNSRFDSRRRSDQSDHRFNNRGGRQGGSRNGAFRGQNGQNRMTPVGLPYVPILLNETFITALWDTGAEKSFISEEVNSRYFTYRPRQKTKDRVVTAQGCHLGRVELQIRIRDFQKTWEFHIRDNMQYQCILGMDFMKDSILTLDFDKKSLIIPDQPGLTHVLYHEIDTGDQEPVVSRPYRYDKVKQGIIDYHIQKMLNEGTIYPIQSPYVSPVALTRKNNGLPSDSPEAYRFAIDYRKLNAITKYPRYPLPLLHDLITNIPYTTIMSSLDLKLGCFQLGINPRHIVKTAFITRNGTFAFNRMPFVLSGAAPNFQKAIDVILKPVLGHFVSFYMDDVIITSPSFTELIDHLNQVFTLLRGHRSNTK